MTQPLNAKDYLKTRHFLEFDQMNTEKKIKSLKEKPTLLWWQKLIFLRQLFKLNHEEK